MNTKVLMVASVLFLGLAGLSLTFLPQELNTHFGSDVHIVILQLMGALYVGFAMMNWTAKGSLIGGIYGRAAAMGNFTHFIMGGILLLKSAFQSTHPLLWALAIIYAVFALLFAYVIFTHPIKKPSFN